MDPLMDKTLESIYGKVKSQVETLTEEIRIIEGSDAWGIVDLDSLTNFPQVIMPLKFNTPEFVKYDGTGDPYAQLCMICRKMTPYGDNYPLLCQNFPLQLGWPRSHMEYEIGKDL